MLNAQIIDFQGGGFNDGWLWQQLTSRGISVRGFHLVQGMGPSAEEVIRFAFDHADLLVMVGAVEDVLEEAISRSLPGLLSQEKQTISLPEAGSAGFFLEYQDKAVLGLPDRSGQIPSAMLEEGLARVRKYFPSASSWSLISFRTCGLSEAQIRDRLHEAGIADVSFALYAHALGVDVQVKLDPARPREPDFEDGVKEKIRHRLGKDLYGEGGQSMEEVVGGLLRQNRHTLATAESCTGGLIASRITDVAGSSDYFIQGVVTYSNQAKQDLLGVKEKTLSDFGAVSEQVVREMCVGLKESSGADLTLAISGIAGPGGGSVEKPVGLVHLGRYDGRHFYPKKFQFQGSRKEIKLQSSQMALDLVRRYYL